MAIFDPGTGGSLVSTTLVKAFFEAALRLQLKEAALTADPNNVTLTADLDGLTVSTDITIPVTTLIDGSGNTVITATDYITAGSGDGSFLNGGGDLSSSHYPAAVMELAQKLHAAEKAVNPEIDNIQLTFNLEAGNLTIAGIFPQITSVGTTGKLEVSPTDYV